MRTRCEETTHEGTVRSEEVAGMQFVKTREDGLDLQEKSLEVKGVESQGFRDPLWVELGFATA